MADDYIHTEARRSWLSDTVTALCGVKYPASRTERVWITWNGPTCPRCRRIKKENR
ncbi:hypothetical protein EV191_101923 [Tamaricihabitans halophyticus]|uniref:Uncharacterized protein n=1 Tax=Tamaricihabitans halophyticus TaxID=1262583 RepID=A0A4R2R345_9PSEU|nr:hypothetical protein [Tamaricihabitans halophyticus]TCP56973.1 hypothetical protein EV191_101923 [Tamaricihabitans halophyticus]